MALSAQWRKSFRQSFNCLVNFCCTEQFPALQVQNCQDNALTVPDEQMDMIRDVFNLFDTDGQQQLDEEELAAAIFAMGFSQHDHVQVSSAVLVIVSRQAAVL